MSRTKRAAIAKETLAIIENGGYANSMGNQIDIGSAVEAAISSTKTYSPNELESLGSEIVSSLASRNFETQFSVSNATTFAAAREAISDSAGAKVLCLNFASAKNPGGGFLGGSQAQEEALCRASALYSCINPHQDYYTTNRKCGSCLYTDYMIYSPGVPVFRDDHDDLLELPFEVSIVTAPAVNAGALVNSEPEKLSQVAEVMFARIEKLLSLAVANDYKHLVLGAWGCGVFRNEPADIASMFYQQLTGTGRFAAAFESVYFGVLDFTTDKATYRAFENQFDG